MSTERDDLEFMLKQCQDIIEEKEQEISELLYQKKNLQNASKQKLELCNELEGRLEELERDNIHLNRQKFKYLKEKEQLSTKLQRLEEEHAALQDSIEKLSLEVAADKKEIVKLKLKQKEDALIFRKRLLDVSLVTSNTKKPDKQCEKLNKTIEELIEQLERNEVELSSEQARVQELETLLLYTSSENRDLKDQLQSELESFSLNTLPENSHCCRSLQPSLFEELEEDENFDGFKPLNLVTSSPMPKPKLFLELEAYKEVPKLRSPDEDSTDSGYKRGTPISWPVNVGTQTEDIVTIEAVDNNIVAYKNGRKINPKHCNRHKVKRLFRDLLDALEQCCDTHAAAHFTDDKAPADSYRHYSVSPKHELATGQGTTNVALIPYKREAIVEDTPKSRTPRRRRSSPSSKDTPPLVGYSNIIYTNKTGGEITIPINSPYRRNRKESPWKDLFQTKLTSTHKIKVS